MEKLDGDVGTKRAVRLAHRPANSMNPTSGKADLFTFQDYNAGDDGSGSTSGSRPATDQFQLRFPK